MVYFWFLVGAVVLPMIVVYGAGRNGGMEPFDYASIFFIELILGLLSLAKWIE
jgi:hypothetical protein